MSRSGLCRNLDYVAFGIMLLRLCCLVLCHIWDYVAFGFMSFEMMSLGLMSFGLMSFGVMSSGLLSVYRSHKCTEKEGQNPPTSTETAILPRLM